MYYKNFLDMKIAFFTAVILLFTWSKHFIIIHSNHDCAVQISAVCSNKLCYLRVCLLQIREGAGRVGCVCSSKSLFVHMQYYISISMTPTLLSSAQLCSALILHHIYSLQL